MEMNKVTTVNDMINSDKFKTCHCGLDKAIYYCRKHCTENNTYCIQQKCMDQHEHKDELIHNINQVLSLKWSCIFEKIENAFEECSDKFEQYGDLTFLCEEEHVNLGDAPPQSQSKYYQDEHQLLKSLYDDAIEQKKELIEDYENDYDIEKLLALKPDNEAYSKQYLALEDFIKFKVDDLFDRYSEVFIKDISPDKVKALSDQSFKLFMDFKRKALVNLVKDQQARIPPQDKSKIEKNQLIVQTVQQFQVIDLMIQRQSEKYEEQMKTIKEAVQNLVMKQQNIIKEITQIRVNCEDGMFEDGCQWTKLFQVNSTDVFDYMHHFWTSKNEFQPQVSRKDFLKSFKLKAFYEIPIQKLLIVCENGQKTILELPAKKPLIEFFISDEVTNLKFISGAKDPVELATGIKDTPFYPETWRINSKPGQYSFRLRLGGYYYLAYSKSNRDKYKDLLGQIGDKEMAGFGILDNCTKALKYGSKSFGIRTSSDRTIGRGQVSIGAVVYGQ